MRITPSIQIRNFLEHLAATKARMDRAQEQMSSGLKVNSLSDDPYAAAQASEIAAVSSENDEFISNNEQLIGKLGYVDNTLQGLIRTLDSARTAAAQALSGTTTPDSRATLAESIDSVRQQVLSISNSQYNGTFLFSGTRRPVGNAFLDNSPGFIYNGNSEFTFQRLDRSTTVQTNITGQELFVDPPAALDVLDALKTAIQNNDATAIRAAADDLELLSNRVNTVAATIGNRIRLVEDVQTRLRDHNLSLQKETSQLVDANLVESISEFNLAQQALDLSLSSQAKIEQLSLLDYLR